MKETGNIHLIHVVGGISPIGQYSDGKQSLNFMKSVT